MNKALILLLLLMIALSGCSSPFIPKDNVTQTISSNDKTDAAFECAKLLTLEQVKTALILHGLQFTENEEEKANDYAINNVTPTVFTIKPNNNILLVYIYDSIALRTEACSSKGIGDYNIRQHLPKDKWFTPPYTTKNIMIVNMCNRKNIQPNNDDLLIWNSLRAVAEILNDVKQLVFTDTGTYWDARLIIKYYQNMYKDNDYYNRYDMYSDEKWLVEYTGSKPQSLHHVKYEYTSGSGGGSCTCVPMEKIDTNYYLSMFDSGGNSIPYKDDVYTLTIQWDDKKETLHLKRSSE